MEWQTGVITGIISRQQRDGGDVTQMAPLQLWLLLVMAALAVSQTVVMDQYVVEVGGEEAAARVAARHGLHNLGQVHWTMLRWLLPL